MKMIGRDGVAVDIPDEDVQQAYQSGQYGFEGDARIPIVTRGGRIGTIPVDSIDEAFAKDARIAGKEEFHHHEVEKKYGQDLGHQLAAIPEGLARGIAGPAPDFLAVQAAKALFGEKAAQETQEHLSGVREANPWTSGISEAVGFGLPFMVPGGGIARGAEAALEGGEAASALARTGEALETAATAAPAARRLQPLYDATRTVGFVPRGIAGLGEVTERTIANINGRDAGTAAGRAAQRIAAKSIAAGVEGAAYGGLEDLDEVALGDHELNGEKMLAAVTHGGLLTGAGVGTLTAGGMLAREVAGRASPMVQKLAGVQAWKAVNPPKPYSETAARRFGGADKIGNTALKYGVFENAATVEDLVKNLKRVTENLGPKVSEAYDVEGAHVKVKDALRVFDDALDVYHDLALHAPERKAIQQAKSDFIANIADALGVKVSEEHIPGGILSQAEIDDIAAKHGAGALTDKDELKKLGIERRDTVEYVRAARTEPAKYLGPEDYAAIQRNFPGKPINSPEVLNALNLEMDAATGALRYKPVVIPEKVLSPAEVLAEARAAGGESILNNSAALKQLGIVRKIGWVFERPETIKPAPSLESVLKAAENTEIPVTDFQTQRKAIGAKAYPPGAAQNQNDPRNPQSVWRDIYRKMGQLENEAYERIDPKMAADVKTIRWDYARLKHMLAAAYKSESSRMSNRVLSLSDYMVAIAAIGTGHPMAAVAKTLGHKWLRERGNAYAARMLNKLANFSAIERATTAIDREVERGIAGTLKPGERAEVRPKEHDFKSYEERAEAVLKAVARPTLHDETVKKVTDAIAPHAPATAQSFGKAAKSILTYLANRIPQGHAPSPNTLQPHLAKPQVSDAEKAKFNRAFDMGHDPIGTTFKRLNQGLLTQTDVANLRAMYPKIYDEIRQKTMNALATQGAKISFDKRMQLGLLLDIPADPAIEPLFMNTMQTTFAEGQPANDTNPPAPKGSPKRKLEVFEEKAKLQTH